ncbi:MAG: DUF4097 family beta strand repeat protein [Phycisphaerales bacterium]|nr:MAG: DUF4097 family beta strand repeat protein [Phycisphaerales bacterium]
MTRLMRTVGLATALASVATSGCAISWSSGTRVWTDPVEQVLVLPVNNLDRVEARTHNGAIIYQGHAEGLAEGKVIAKVKGGGDDLADAQAALEAIEVFVEPSADGTTRIGRRWKGVKKSTWGCSVDFQIDGPAELAFDAETHNGAIKARAVSGDIKAKTHNGGVDVQGDGGTLWAKTHNGAIEAEYKGQQVDLITHNGRVEVRAEGGPLDVVTHNGRISAHHVGGPAKLKTHNGGIRVGHAGESLEAKTHNGAIEADLAENPAPQAKLKTHNGRVTILLAEEASAKIDLDSDGGHLECELPLSNAVIEKKRGRMTGTIGDGSGRLTAETHRGRISIEKK